MTSNGSGWFWAWALGIPSSSQKVDAAKSFVKWATSKDYITLVGEESRLGRGTSRHAQVDLRQSEVPGGGAVREVVYEAVANADITKPTKDPVPYIGIQYVAIPEFQGIGTHGRPAGRRGAGRAGDGRRRRSRPRSGRPSGR